MITIPDTFFQVIFEATWAKRGFVGIDDISVTDKG